MLLVVCPACYRPVSVDNATLAGGDAIRVSKWIKCHICPTHLNVSAYRQTDGEWSRWYVLSWRDQKGHWHDGPERVVFMNDSRAALPQEVQKL